MESIGLLAGAMIGFLLIFPARAIADAAWGRQKYDPTLPFVVCIVPWILVFLVSALTLLGLFVGTGIWITTLLT